MLRGKRRGCPDVDVARRHEVELARHHTDHFIRRVVQRDLSPEHVRRRAESPLPQAVADHGHAHAARVFVLCEDASEDRLRAENGPEVPGDPAARQFLGLAVARERHLSGVGRGDVREHRVEAAPRVPLRGRRIELLGTGQARVVVPDHDQTAGVRIGQRPDQDGIDGAEHRGVDADAERQRADGDRRERRIAADLAQAIADILSDLLHKRPATRAITLSRRWGRSSDPGQQAHLTAPLRRCRQVHA